MLLKSDIVAKKYAQALLNLYYILLNKRCFESLIALESFFRKNKRLSVYLSIPTISDEVKAMVLQRIFESLGICKTITRLVNALLKHRRIELLVEVTRHIIREYRIRRRLLVFKVTTSHVLPLEEQKKVINFLQDRTGATISATFDIDKSLIAGIKIQGDTLLWERSIARRLMDVKRSVLRRVELW